MGVILGIWWFCGWLHLWFWPYCFGWEGFLDIFGSCGVGIMHGCWLIRWVGCPVFIWFEFRVVLAFYWVCGWLVACCLSVGGF